MTIDMNYLAGFFDGEGHIGICEGINKRNGNPYFFLNATLSNNHRGVLEQVQKDHGGTLRIAGGQYTIYKCLNLVWQSQKAAEFIRKIEPYLIIKKDQAELALEFDLLIDRITRPRPRATVESLEEKRWFMDEIKRIRV